MDIGSIFLVLGLFVLVALFIGRPFIERKATSVSQEEHEYSALLAERDRLLNALQELDFDHALGKIPDADYPAQRTILLQQGADVLRKLDAMQAEKSSEDVEMRIEAAIAARRADAARVKAVPVMAGARPVPADGSPDDDLEVLLANRRRSRSEKAAGFCPQCGGPVQKSDRFCPKCGATLA